MSGEKPHWYAVRTVYGRERAVQARLEAVGMAVYIPQQEAPCRFGERPAPVAGFAFHGLLFVRAQNPARIGETAREPIQFITDLATGSPICLGNGRMQQFIRVAAHGSMFQPDNSSASLPRVRISDGALAGVEGFGQPTGNTCRVKVPLPGTGLAAEAEVPAYSTELLTN